MRCKPLRCCYLLLGLLMTDPLWADAPVWSLDKLMALFSTIEHRAAEFTEIRELALLDNSLESSGTLTFDAPDSLRKSFDPPLGLSYEINGNRLSLHKADGSQETVLLDNAPQLIAYVASLRAVLAGDLSQLELYFDTRLNGTEAAWLLTLVPKDSKLKRQISHIEISGRQAEIEQFIIIEQGGDRTLTRLQARREN